MTERERRNINFGLVMMLMDRYGPLLEWLENETDGFCTVSVLLHGRRPVKVRIAGEWHKLPLVDYEIDASP